MFVSSLLHFIHSLSSDGQCFRRIFSPVFYLYLRPFYGDVRNWRVVLSEDNLEVESGREIYRRIARIISVSSVLSQCPAHNIPSITFSIFPIYVVYPLFPSLFLSFITFIFLFISRSPTPMPWTDSIYFQDSMFHTHTHNTDGKHWPSEREIRDWVEWVDRLTNELHDG